MQTIILIVHVLVAIGLIGLVLIQHGKGADAGAAFGAGASATVFGSRGAGSALTRTTAILATVFFVTSLWLAYFSGRGQPPKSVVERAAETETVPVAPTQAREDVPALPEQKKGKTEQPAADVPAVVPAQNESVPAISDKPAVEQKSDAAPVEQPAPAKKSDKKGENKAEKTGQPSKSQ